MVFNVLVTAFWMSEIESDTPSSGISLFGTKSNQQVLNLASTEGVQAQSLFIGPKLLDDFRVVGWGIVVQKEPVTRFTHGKA